MHLKKLLILFVTLWLLSAVGVPYFFGSLEDANNFGGSFGGVSALFSGLALALAICSMVLQQKQGAEFERVTLEALRHQAAAIKLIEESLQRQAAAARVTAVSTLIEREEQRIETLKQWGAIAGDENKYAGGIKAAQRRIERYHEELRRLAEG